MQFSVASSIELPTVSHFGALGSAWDSLGISIGTILPQSWGLGATLGAFWEHSGSTLGIHWDFLGIIWASCGHFKPTLGSSWYYLGISLGTFWHNLGTQGSLWHPQANPKPIPSQAQGQAKPWMGLGLGLAWLGFGRTCRIASPAILFIAGVIAGRGIGRVLLWKTLLTAHVPGVCDFYNLQECEWRTSNLRGKNLYVVKSSYRRLA